MGAMQNNPPTKKRGKNSRGSVRNADRLSAFVKVGPADGADWGGVTPERLQDVILKITRLGGAVMFGVSKDTGAYSLTLLLDGSKQTLWFNGDAELDEELEAVAATLDTID